MAASQCGSASATHGFETKTITMQLAAPNRGRSQRPAMLDLVNGGWPRLLGLFIGATVCSAQGDRGGIIGRLIDPTQAVVIAATVTAKNLETGYTRETKSGDDGSFLFSLLDAGRYRIEVTAEGFATLIRGPITVP